MGGPKKHVSLIGLNLDGWLEIRVLEAKGRIAVIRSIGGTDDRYYTLFKRETYLKGREYRLEVVNFRGKKITL